MFNNLIGNTENKETLKNMIDSNNISHSYIFSGTSGIGKFEFAKEFAKAIICLSETEPKPCNHCKACESFDNSNNPDIIIIDENEDSIKTETIKELTNNILEKPIQGNKKIYIINNSENMTKEAQNSILKTLEEPPEYVTIILICSNEDNMLSTIKSRCTRIHFENLEISEVKDYIKQNYPEIEIDDSIINLSQGSIGKALKLNENKTLYENIENILKSFKNKDIIDIVKMSEEIYIAKEEIYSVLEYMNVLLLKLSKEDLRYINAIDIVEETKKRLKANSNYDMCIDNLLFNISYLFRK